MAQIVLAVAPLKVPGIGVASEISRDSAAAVRERAATEVLPVWAVRAGALAEEVATAEVVAEVSVAAAVAVVEGLELMRQLIIDAPS